MKTKDLNKKQLGDYFAEHVRYEIQMLLNATGAMLQQLSVPRGLQFMILESYVMHLRNLISFFYPSHIRDTDVCAENFFIKKETWEKIKPTLSKKLKGAKIRADKEVGHLTTFRRSGTPKNKVWEVKNLTDELMVLFKTFTESVDKIDLTNHTKELWAHHAEI